MKKALLAILIVTPILSACSSDKGSTQYRVVPAKGANSTSSGGATEPVTPPAPTSPATSTGSVAPTIPVAPTEPATPVLPGTILVPSLPPPPPAPKEPVAPQEPKVPAQPEPVKPVVSTRIIFGQPERPFNVREFIPKGFSPEKTLTEEQFVRERRARGCQSNSVEGLVPGSQIATHEASYSQFDNQQVYFQMKKVNRISSVSDGNISYTRLISDFRSEAPGSDIVNKNEKCNFIFGEYGGFTKCPFVRGNNDYRNYIARLEQGKNCRSVSRTSRGYKRQGYYMSGKFTLPDGKTVRALLSRTRAPRLETCEGSRRDFNDYSVQVISEKLQSADGACANVFDLTIYQAKDRYQEWNKVIKSAPLK